MKYLYENLGFTLKQAGKIFDYQEPATLKHLRRIGTKIRKHGGARLTVSLTCEQINNIRSSKYDTLILSEEYGISISTIYSIKNRRGRWAKY